MTSVESGFRSLLFGVAIGDALGVPVEFSSRDERRRYPVTEMTGYGTHHQPAGTWSDDSSLTFCLAETLTKEVDLLAIAGSFVRWYDEGYWTPHGEVFDIGITTANAIGKLKKGIPPERAADRSASSNGNGSLMRIGPLLFILDDVSPEERFAITRNVSAITHGHIRSAIACHICLEFLRGLQHGSDKMTAYRAMQRTVLDFLCIHPDTGDELAYFDRILRQNIAEEPEENIKSGGYVVETLEASFWCFLRTDSFSDAVLTAVNLGSDTDTTGAVTGGMAGLYYGANRIPSRWIEAVARRDDVEDLVRRTAERLTET